MAPLKGLQTLGTLVFKWAAGISVAVALGSAFGPETKTTAQYLMAALFQLERTQGILTLCLLLFVCFAIRPMGLSYASRIFGVSLGLGLLATYDFVQTAWLALHPEMSNEHNLINGFVICTVLATWTAYFVIPEPKRRLIVLPTTSPFLRWNQISQALGDDPGFVAVGGVPPDLFAPAELEVMRRASLKMVPALPKPATSAPPQVARISASTAV
jgi:amino acid transporter